MKAMRVALLAAHSGEVVDEHGMPVAGEEQVSARVCFLHRGGTSRASIGLFGCPPQLITGPAALPDAKKPTTSRTVTRCNAGGLPRLIEAAEGSGA